MCWGCYWKRRDFFKIEKKIISKLLFFDNSKNQIPAFLYLNRHHLKIVPKDIFHESESHLERERHKSLEKTRKNVIIFFMLQLTSMYLNYDKEEEEEKNELC